MNIQEISKPITASFLNETLAKNFGKKIALEKFTLEQLHDARNKVRTKLSQVETNESFSSTQTEDYQKSKMFLSVLNAEIQERESIQEKAKSVKQQQAAGIALANRRGQGKTKPKGAAASMSKMSTRELEKFAKTKHRGLPKVKNESILREGPEEAAELVMASKDMVDRITSWMEDTAEMQTRSMIELTDAVRDEMGLEQSESFINVVKPSLESLFSALETTREALISGVGILTGETSPGETMGEPDEGDEDEYDMGDEDEFDTELGGSDEFGASPPAVGGDEQAGRARRESRDYRNQKKR